MAPQFKFFRVPVTIWGESEEELNGFLRSVQVLGVDRSFVADCDRSFVFVTVEYHTHMAKTLPGVGKSKVDYRDVLPPEDFALFARLRAWRKERAEREGVAVYTIFTNDQLARIARERVGSRSGLLDISGIGEGKVEKYGADILNLVAEVSRSQKEAMTAVDTGKEGDEAGRLSV